MFNFYLCMSHENTTLVLSKYDIHQSCCCFCQVQGLCKIHAQPVTNI
uniref:Uncharacterized protein n=1 Tax=Arundo donax TaxID=35708 RepID=A0A0A9CSE0_ARUDO